MVKFNPIHLNMHRQGLVRTTTSFIMLQLLLLLRIALLRACMAAAQICLRGVRERWWERNVIGKAIEHLSLHQTAWDYDFFFSPTPSVFGREERSTAVAILAFIASPLHPSSPHWASILAILGSWWIPVVGKMAERSESMPVSCRACFSFVLIVRGSSRGLIDLKMSLAGGLFCPILLFFHPSNHIERRDT